MGTDEVPCFFFVVIRSTVFYKKKKNMQIKVLDQERFKVAKNQFIVGPSANGYTLAYSADGVNFTEYTEATPAGENLIVNGVPQYAWCKLVGNQGEVDVIL